MHLHWYEDMLLDARRLQILLVLILAFLFAPFLLKFFTNSTAIPDANLALFSESSGISLLHRHDFTRWLPSKQQLSLAEITGMPLQEITGPVRSRQDLISMLMRKASAKNLEKFGVEWECYNHFWQSLGKTCVDPLLLPKIRVLAGSAEDYACWVAKDEYVNANEITTPIMYPKDENYDGIKEVMERFEKHEIEFDTDVNAVHVHVNFPRAENLPKLISLFTRLEPVLIFMSSRFNKIGSLPSSNYPISTKILCFHGLPMFEQEQYYNYDRWYRLRTDTGYGTVEFRSIIDLTWNPEINVQNIILSQTIAKIANMEPKLYIEILKTIEEILPFEKFKKEVCDLGLGEDLLVDRIIFPGMITRPTDSQVVNILKLLEDVAKTDTFFKESKTQPNFKILQKN